MMMIEGWKGEDGELEERDGKNGGDVNVRQ